MLRAVFLAWAGAIILATVWPAVSAVEDRPAGQPRVEVRLGPKLQQDAPFTGRVVVVLSQAPADDLLRLIGDTGMRAAPIFGADAHGLQGDQAVVIDGSSTAFPLKSLAGLPAGEYHAQAVLRNNRDLNLLRAPLQPVSKVKKIRLGAGEPTPVLLLEDRLPDEKLPPDTDRVKYLKFPSKLLSDFHGRPMFYRAAVVLPPGFAEEPDRKYPLRVHIGGFGSRFTFARGLVRNSGPKLLTLMLDGAGPFGDPYHVNSANNGPYGDALTQELIPYVEKTYRGLGLPGTRFTDGGSTGGWVSLALQIFYPDFFGGCWSQCPDSLDFRSFELIDIYRDGNAYVNAYGFERPAKRTISGDTVYTVRHEVQVENVLGLGGRWTLSGKDWGSWNAAYGPRGGDGLPVPLWDPKSGVIDRSVTKHWEQYDLRLVVERNWPTLAPKLNGKIRIWVGDADDYFLNNGVHHFKKMAAGLKNPPFEGKILIEMRQPHTSGGWTEAEMLAEMAELGERNSRR